MVDSPRSGHPTVHHPVPPTRQQIIAQVFVSAVILVSGVVIGSGGTIQGIGSFLKEKNPQVMIVAVEPKNVSALLGHEPGLHQ
ncbi:MAG TPA: hypothetical protein PK373_03845, partial [Sedimentisphaerales bacterium]|nr:hypothetical protein [Sedimentisphaerales bacterium]